MSCPAAAAAATALACSLGSVCSISLAHASVGPCSYEERKQKRKEAERQRKQEEQERRRAEVRRHASRRVGGICKLRKRCTRTWRLAGGAASMCTAAPSITGLSHGACRELFFLVLQGRQRMAAMTEEEQAKWREERNARGLARKQERQEAKARMEKVGGVAVTARG